MAQGTTDFQIRPYQQEAITAIGAEWRKGNRRTLLVLPTGTGKTIVFCRIVDLLVKHRNERVLILAHRGELLEQAADKLSRATGLSCALEKADSTCKDSLFRVVVGSVQTLMSEKRLSAFPSDYFDTIIVDECHHVMADSYIRILEHFSGAKVLGVTATPDRGDRADLGKVFQSLAYEYTLPRAIRDGYLCPIQALSIPLEIDLKKVRQTAGDYSAEDLGLALDPYLERIAEHMATHCRDRKSVVFLPLVATSKRMRDILAEHGFDAAEVNGNSKDRAEVLRDYSEGRYDVLCNSMLLTEGWDCPPVDCIVPLRPTKIRSLFCQMVGRGTRPSPQTGKENLLLLDFLWATTRMDLCRPAHIIAEDATLAARMTEAVNKGAAQDLLDLHDATEVELVHERDAALAKKLEEMRKKKQRLVDPLQFEMSILAQDLSSYVPTFGWEYEPATAPQRTFLEKAGIDPDGVECAGKASQIIDRLQKRRKCGLSTPKQIRFLEGKGFREVGTWSNGAASKMISRIHANAWMVPRGIIAAQYQPPKGE